MWYKCCECGHLFEEGEQARWREDRGEFWGEPCSEMVYGCPICKGEYQKAEKCQICGKLEFKEDLNSGVCNDCIDERRKDFDMCYIISSTQNSEIEINSLLATLFDKSDIETILYHYIKEKCKDVDCSQFIDDDILWFGQRLAEEVKKNENAKG